jgi:hypothetical protein
MDFLPAIRSKGSQSSETEMQMAEEGGMRGVGDGAAESQQYFRGNVAPVDPVHGNGYANGHTNGYTNGHTNGHANGNINGNGYVSHTADGYPKPATPPLASRNF